VDQSPAAVGKGRGKGQRRPRKPKAVPGQLPVNAMGMNQPQMAQGQPGMSMQVPGPNPQMHNMPGYAQGPGMPQQGQQYANANNQQHWYGQQQQQPGYYPPQMANVNRFERPQQINQSKQALSNLLRSRHPINQFMGPGGQNPQGPGPQAANYGPMRQFPRQPMRQQHPGAIQQNQVSEKVEKN
jgi:hypothetical protein